MENKGKTLRQNLKSLKLGSVGLLFKPIDEIIGFKAPTELVPNIFTDHWHAQYYFGHLVRLIKAFIDSIPS